MVFTEGRKVVSKSFVLYYKKNALSCNRLGIVASKKTIGNAVARNRAKRLIREVYRSNRPNYDHGFDIVFVARAGLLKLSFNQLNLELKNRLVLTGLLNLTQNG